ncbi:hypothetical protein HanXRQr2_Chr10g0446721 [Helianthus annuus]|uniref:Uncharacterized protein n=1 Tax=Helianthus annuus TaxID=4232 RepID=A0A251TJL3_HELAN|nr:hypothetical protein HanXRQr2_Chr10g0446721 [Helianthus annuus]
MRTNRRISSMRTNRHIYKWKKPHKNKNPRDSVEDSNLHRIGETIIFKIYSIIMIL